MRKNKPVLLALVFVLILSMFTACAGGSNTPAANGGDSTPGATTAAGGDAPAEELPPYELVWYILGPAQQRDNELVEQAVNAYLKDKINATVKMTLLDWASYDQKLKATIASGEPFDICFTGAGQNDHIMNSRNGAFVPLNDYFDTYLSGTKEIVGDTFLRSAQIDGVNYGVPANKEKARAYGFVYNKTLADEYDIDMSTVKSYSDIEDYLKIIQENVTDFAPLFNDSVQNLPFIEWNSFAASDKVGTINLEGKVINQFASDEFMTAYKEMRDFYNKGYLRKDVATMKDGQSLKSNGEFFTFPVTLKPGYADEQNIVAKTKGHELAQIYVTDIWAIDGFGSLQCISRTSKNPDRAAMFLELVNTDKELNNLINFGVEGTHYNFVGDNVIEQITDSGYMPNMQWMYGNQFLNYLNVHEAADKWAQFETFNTGAREHIALGFVFDETPVQNEVAACLSVAKEYNDVLKLGVVDPEATVPEFVAKLEAAGANKIIEEKQAQFDAWLAAK